MAKAKMLTPEEIAAVLAHVEARSRYPERDRVMVLLSVRAGLRASEIAGLAWEHVLTADGSAVAEEIDLPRQVTKGEKRARVIPIHDELKAALEALRTLWSDRVAPGGPVIFSERGRYGANGVAHWFKRIYQNAGLVGASSHSGRRTLLTNLARNCAQAGASLRDVQRIAGHADLGTTERYVEPSLEAQRRLIALT
jgi:integrase/recombinase XerD